MVGRLSPEQLADHFDRLGDHPSRAALREHIDAIEVELEAAETIAHDRRERAKRAEMSLELARRRISELEQESAAYRAQLEGRLR